MAEDNMYRCSSCGNEYESDWSDADAAAEFEQNFRHSDFSRAAVICDDCYQAVMTPKTRSREQHMRSARSGPSQSSAPAIPPVRLPPWSPTCASTMKPQTTRNHAWRNVADGR